MEILAPAGSRESLEAAVQSGADAVYMGGGLFQARAYAAGVGDLAQAVAYAHTWGVDVHFTLNTVILDREADAWAAQAAEAVEAGVDAIITADLGGLYLLRRMYPDVPLHASTQLSVRSPQSARAYAAVGCSRVVLAREVPAEEVRTICREAGCEIEVFGHGALCVCASGRCLMSSLLGGRSANRGACAQPCRLKYTLADQDGYFLNTRDLSLADEIDTLRDCGVASLKIEGRMKGPLYVTAAVQAFREALETGRVSEEAMEALVATFSRGGFTHGGFGHDPNRFFTAFPGHTGQELGKVTQVRGPKITVEAAASVSPGDTVAAAGADQPAATVRDVRSLPDGALELVVSGKTAIKQGATLYKKTDSRVEDRLRTVLKSGRTKTPLTASFAAIENTPIRLTVTLPNGRHVSAEGPVPEKARTRALDEAALAGLIERTGNTPFSISELRIELGEGLALPRSAVNALRREVLDKAEAMLADRYPDRARNAHKPQPIGAPNTARPSRIACLVQSRAQAEACAPYADILYVPASSTMQEISGCTVMPVLSSMASGPELDRAMDAWSGPFLTGCLLEDMHGCVAGADFNVTNSYALDMLHELGAARATLSQELNTAQIRDLKIPTDLETEVVAYGRQTLMLTENCPVPCDRTHCRVRKEHPALTDRTGRSFPLQRDHCDTCRVRILNALPLWSADMLDELCCDVVRLEMTTEDPDECMRVCKAYREALNGTPQRAPEGEYTRGHLKRGLKASSAQQSGRHATS